MCKISNQLKLCTCNDVDAERLTDYWVLYREGGEVVIGDLLPPSGLLPEVGNYNHEVLTRLLNAGNCFNFDAQFEENDCLELNFSITPELRKYVWALGHDNVLHHIRYEYEYKAGKWVDAEFGFGYVNSTEKMRGKIVNTFGKDDS